MRFRPCIDIHNGQVKQIIGGSLMDQGDAADENFVSNQDAAFYANLYKESGLKGGHIILLNPVSSPYYNENLQQAYKALSEYPNGLQIGGGITVDNAKSFLAQGASHVIVTSYVFQEGKVNYENLERLAEVTGRSRLVLDLSCRKKDGQYYIVTDRWQKFTNEIVSVATLNRLSTYCDEFLIHAVDVEGKANGIEEELVTLLGGWSDIPITYAGGVGSYQDLDLLRKLGQNKLDVTIGSALDLFGGPLEYDKIVKLCR